MGVDKSDLIQEAFLLHLYNFYILKKFSVIAVLMWVFKKSGNCGHDQRVFGLEPRTM